MTVARNVLWGVAGLALGAALHPAYLFWTYSQQIHPQLPDPATVDVLSFDQQEIDPAWIIEGQPRFEAMSYAISPDGHTESGLWQCRGPAKFEWHYTVDERIYILEGDAKITYNGQSRQLLPGATVYFRAGTVVQWEVPHFIKKTFTLQNPGRIAGVLRQVLPP